MTPDFCLVCILLIPLAAAGLALIHQGLGRSRSAAHAMLATLCAWPSPPSSSCLIGSSWMGFPTGLAHTLHLAGKSIDWLGAEPLLRQPPDSNLTHRLPSPRPRLRQVFAVGLAALIPISAGTDRWRLASICAATPSSRLHLPTLRPLGLGQRLARPTHPALPPPPSPTSAEPPSSRSSAASWPLRRLDPRPAPRQVQRRHRHRHPRTQHRPGPLRLPARPHRLDRPRLRRLPSSSTAAPTPEQILLTVINAVLSASAGCLAAVLTTQIRYRKPDASLSANGWIAGLVAGSAGCGLVSPLAAIFIGLIAGASSPCSSKPSNSASSSTTPAAPSPSTPAPASGASSPSASSAPPGRLPPSPHPRPAHRHRHAARPDVPPHPRPATCCSTAHPLPRRRRRRLARHGHPRARRRRLPRVRRPRRRIRPPLIASRRSTRPSVVPRDKQ
jgi:hypothetical protein